MRRLLQVVETGQWLAEESRAERFPSGDAIRYPAAVCLTFGLPAGSLQAVYLADDAPDPRQHPDELLHEGETPLPADAVTPPESP